MRKDTLQRVISQSKKIYFQTNSSDKIEDCIQTSNNALLLSLYSLHAEKVFNFASNAHVGSFFLG